MHPNPDLVDIKFKKVHLTNFIEEKNIHTCYSICYVFFIFTLTLVKTHFIPTNLILSPAPLPLYT